MAHLESVGLELTPLALLVSELQTQARTVPSDLLGLQLVFVVVV